MANFNAPEPTPRVGVRGNAQNTPVLEKRESINASGSTPNYVAAFNNLASTPTALGILSSAATTNASIALANKMGTSLGKTPEGNLLPPITDFDKHVTEAYSSQAQVTLGLQANSLILNAQEEVTKANKITPALIDTYKQSAVQGIQSILDMAPDTIRPQMEHQLGTQIQNSTHQLTLHMIERNKSDAASRDSVWRTHQSEQISNAIKDGNIELAQEMQQSLNRNIDSGLYSGVLTPLQADTAKTAAKLNFESAKSIQKVMQARANGTEPEYLASIADKKIGDLSWSESEAVRDNTFRYLGAVESAENRDQALIEAQGQGEILSRTMNPDTLATYEAKLRPLVFQNLKNSYISSQRKQATMNSDVARILSNPGNVNSYAGKSAKVINDSYDGMTNYLMQKSQNSGNPISLEEAQFQAASSMATSIPKFTDMINRELKGENPEQIMKAIETYERMSAVSGYKTDGVDPKALAKGELFMDLLASNPADPVSAAQQANDIINKKDEKTLSITNLKIAEYMKQYASDSNRALSTAINLSGLDISAGSLENPDHFASDVFNRFKGYMQLTDGNEDVSKKRVQADLAKQWGTTYINGKKQTTLLPIEQQMHLDPSAAPLIQQDVINQLGPQLEETKKTFDSRHSPFYWRIKDRLSFDEYAKAKVALAEDKYRDPDIEINRTIVSKFESAPPIQLEQVMRNKEIHTYELNVQASPYAQRSQKNGEVLGGYNIQIKDPVTKAIQSMPGYYGTTKTLPEYRPNTDWVKERYSLITGHNAHTFEELKAMKEEEFNRNFERQQILARQVQAWG